MRVTHREQQILAALSSQKIATIAELMNVTGTSRRTLYRDLDSLSNSLPDDVNLVKSDNGYQLSGNLSNLTTQEMQDFTATERWLGETSLLMTDQASITKITEEFWISQPTATADLRVIGEVLAENDIQLLREKGLKIAGNEEKIRSVFVAVALQDEKKFDHELLRVSYETFETVNLPEMTDKTRHLLELFLAVSLIRQKNQHFVTIDNGRNPSKQAISLVNELISQLSNPTFTIAEITYLAGIYDVLYFGFGRQPLFLEKFDTDFSYKIRQLIEKISQNLNIEFSKDDRLYGLLYAHLKEIEILPELFANQKNSFVAQIESDNQKIFEAVKTVLPEVFQKSFSDKEIAFVTMHFVATLERSDLVLPLRAAIVSNHGRISCEMLISNLRKNFPFLTKIDLIQTSVKIDKASYDVIFTTERNLDFIYVERFLQQKNLDDIRHKLREIQQNGKPVKSHERDENFVNLNQLFNVGNQIVKDFELSELQNSSNFAQTVEKITEQLKLPELTNLLIERFDETHLGIPETKIALLHGVHEAVKFPYFGIFQLENSIKLRAMDDSTIDVSRILLLISPKNIAEQAALILGKISSSIIENKLYTKIYESGNDEIIRELLRQIVSESIRNY